MLLPPHSIVIYAYDCRGCVNGAKKKYELNVKWIIPDYSRKKNEVMHTAHKLKYFQPDSELIDPEP